VGSVVWAAPAAADSISVGNAVRILGSTGTIRGGAFSLDNLATGPGVDFLTFCLQRTQYIDYGTEFVVGAITNHADDTPLDPISHETAWIYTQFREGALDPIFGPDAIQAAIWYLEQEWTTNVANSAALRAAAAAAVAGGWINQGVAVLNLFYRDGRPAQDQLTYTPPNETQVPEPSLLLLLGGGLAGAAAVTRRRRLAAARNRPPA
jgi:hypothetical protein